MPLRDGRGAAFAQERECAGRGDRPAVGDRARPPLHRVGRAQRRRFRRPLVRAERPRRGGRAGAARRLRQPHEDHLEDRESRGPGAPRRDRRSLLRHHGGARRPGRRAARRGHPRGAAPHRGEVHRGQAPRDHRHADALLDGACAASDAGRGERRGRCDLRTGGCRDAERRDRGRGSTPRSRWRPWRASPARSSATRCISPR